MKTRTLGRTGLEVSRLGFGLAEIGGLELAASRQAARVLNLALDNGITFFDTAACYGNSEELIGRTIAHRRDEVILATKAGHVAGGYEGQAWTAQTIRDSIDRSLQRLRTDHLDIVQLHTCDIPTLERGEAIRVIQEAQQAGKTRFIGYSGDNEAALWAVNSGIFDTLQTSFNLVDQRARHDLFGPAVAQNVGIIVKRPIGNGVWGAASLPRAPSAPSDYAADYFARARVMLGLGPLPAMPDSGILLALGFAFAHEAVDTFIVGTQNPKHMQANIDWVNAALPIADAPVLELRRRFDQLHDPNDWVQLS